MRAANMIYLVLVLLSVFLVIHASDGSDASADTSYGSSEGTKAIEFDSCTSDSDGFVQYVLAGNTIHFPTGRTVHRDGYILMGWKDTDTGEVFHPGDAYGVYASKSFKAVWRACTERGSWGTAVDHSNSTEYLGVSEVSANAGFRMDLKADTAYDYGAHLPIHIGVIWRGSEQTGYISSTGLTYSQEYGAFIGAVTLNNITFTKVVDGDDLVHFYVSGNPGLTGTAFITMYAGTSVCYTYAIQVSDAGTDPSRILHATVFNRDGSVFRDLCGPSGTAVRLPSDALSGCQKGWEIDVDGSPAVFPIGGTYTITKSVRIDAAEYTYEEIITSGKAGILAYDVNGGYYRGQFAAFTEVGGYTALAGGDSVTKDGYTFIGWNQSGDASDPIYFPGYLYDTPDGYNVLKAVWATSASAARIELRIPGYGMYDAGYDAYSGYDYWLPVHSFAPAGYSLKGWSRTAYDIGEGSPVGEYAAVSSVGSENTYYAVFEELTYRFTIIYDGNGASGGSTASATVSRTYSELVSEGGFPYAMEVSQSGYYLIGSAFLGWATSPYADSPEYSPGSVYLWSGSGTATLYAVWSLRPVTDSVLITVTYHGNCSSSVTGMPSSWYRVIDSREYRFLISSQIPVAAGYDFEGWSLSPNGGAEYRPGSVFILSASDGSNTASADLYAVWTYVGTGDGSDIIVTFSTESWRIPVQVSSGDTVAERTAPSVPGSFFLGWYHGGEKWDFSLPVTEPMILFAKYLEVFDLEVVDGMVKVIMKCSFSRATVTFSDGFSETYYSSIPVHAVDADGTVTVSAEVEGVGIAEASRTFSITGATATEEDDNGGSEIIDVDLPVIAAAVLAAIAGFFILRRFI